MTEIAQRADRATGAGETLVSLDGVTVAFGGVLALNAVTLDVTTEDGIVGIIGPNGAGKSTCLSVIAGARPATSGTVTALGRPLGSRPNPTRMSRAGVVRTFQIPRPFAEMTIRENVVVALASKKRARTSVLVREADVLLERLGLGPLAGNKAGSLPLAVRKKLEVGRAVASSPRLLLLDEVFEGLSDTEITDMVRILRELHDDGIHLVLVEHVLRALRQLAQTLVVFEKGQVLAHGDLETVLDSAEVKQAYLGGGGVEA